MKQSNVKNKSLAFCLIFVVALIFCGIGIQSNSNKIYAVSLDEIDENYAIKNDGAILSTNLWDALYKFYNANYDKATMSPLSDSLYINIFKDFTVDTLDLSSKSIDSIANLRLFDMSKFETINLSNNKLLTTNSEFKNLANLKNLNLSKNNLSSFSFNELNITSYSSNLQSLDLSQNKLTSLNLKDIAQGSVNAQLNVLTTENLILPTSSDVKVELSHNLLTDISEQNLSNTNLSFGFQGVKDSTSYVETATINFYGLDELTSIEIYSADKSDKSILTSIKTLNKNESYNFSIGYFLIRFQENATFDILKDISIYVSPDAPIAKMFLNGKEIELSHKVSEKVTIKFFGKENAEIHYILNNADDVKSDTLTLDKESTNNIVIYQIVDGYKSAQYTLYVVYQQNSVLPWIYVFIGIGVFALLFFLAIKFMPNFINIGLKDKDKKNLD